MVNFSEMYNILAEKGQGKAISAKGTEYKIEARDGKIIAYPASGRVTIHEDCWGKNITCQRTRAGGIYNGPYSIFDWYRDNT